MPSISKRFTIIMLALAFAARAEAEAGDWYVAPSIIWNDDGADRAIDDSLSGAEIRVGRDLSQHLSLEGLLGYSDISGYCPKPSDCYPDQKHLDISANLLTYFNRDRAFAPYLVFGIGYLGVDADTGPQFAGNTGKDNNPTTAVGIGFKWRMGQSNVSIHGRYRFRTAFDNSTLTDRLATIGIQFNFGGPGTDIGVPEPNKDRDGDGVLDRWDACPGSKPGVEVTPRGCEINELDRDDDKDHIVNNDDQCPGTPIGVAVDRVGCSLDSDMDGVTTSEDRCPASRAGAEVNAYGCEVDDDEDGVPDHRDDCLATRAGVRVDVKGCEIRDIISLPGVNFETGHDILLPGTEYLLRQAADTLKMHPELQIEVAGHTDDVGNEDLNQGLSMRRAKTVRDFLIGYGVDAGRLTFRGYGETQPIADNSTVDGRATNRRVELRLLTR